MRLELNLRVAQTVTPQMILSMTILQYSAQELEEYLEDLSYENPLMDVEKTVPETGENQFIEQLRWLRNEDRQNQSYYSEQEAWRPEAAPGRGETLCDHVKEQILTMKVSKSLRRAMETAAELLTPRGFFDGTPGEVAALAGCEEATAREALERIKMMEPAGVGAGDVQECMLLQLDRLPGQTAIARRLVKEQFSHLATWPTPRLASAMNLGKREVEEARRLISGLRPYPGYGFSGDEEIQYIRPDLMVYEEDGELLVSVLDEAVPQIKVNGEYIKLMESESDPEVQKYLRQKLSQLEQVVKNIGNRKSTMLQCAEILVRRQIDFFRGGSVRKMTLRDVAEEMNVHESTVSRTVRGKYIQCQRGVYEMAFFFSRDAGQNIGVSRNLIKDRVQQVIAQEDPAKPLSDEKIVAILAEENLILSRRTVAKYRMELGILAASSRKLRKND